MDFIPCKSRTTAKRHCPRAVKIIKVPNGYLAFNDLTLYRVWRNAC